MTSLFRFATLMVLWQLAGCMQQPPPTAKPEPPKLYQPDFTYNVAETGATSDVTVGVVGAQFSGDGEDWWRDHKSDEVAKQMVRQLRTGFEALLVAKGLRTTGPFDAVDEMTYPEKKTSTLVLYPDFDLVLSMKASPGVVAKGATEQPKQGNQTSFSLGNLMGSDQSGAAAPKPGCTANITVSGAVLLVLKEPISGQKMWVKKLDVSEPTQELAFEGLECDSVDGVTRGARNAWAKTNEKVFQSVMSSLDRYLSLEELQMIAGQADTLRSQTRFAGQ